MRKTRITKRAVDVGNRSASKLQRWKPLWVAIHIWFDSSIRTILGTIGKTAEKECVVHAQIHGDISNVQLTKGALSEQ